MYIELLVIKDLLFNFINILTVGVFLNRKIKFKNVFLSSVVGTMDLIMYFICDNELIINIFSFLLLNIMSFISFKYHDILYYIKNIFYMYIVSIFYAGTMYIINIKLFPKINSDLIYTVILFILIPIISFIYTKSIKNVILNNIRYYDISIYINNNIINLIAFLDTGNKLYDPYKHKPIILIRKNMIDSNYCKKLIVPYNTVNNHNLLECIIPDKIFIKDIGYRYKFLVGLVDEINIEGADCILNEGLL